ncbi:MAG TPA: endonuclease III [Longimicrobiaceae bacterium]|nr:endonuclease III [Longimicrobiaceae bacterium]
MPRETKKAKRARTQEILARLAEMYPDSRCSLTHESPFELLVATVLSAQCTDARVNQVTPALFRRYPDAAAMAEARQEDVEEMVRSTGFFRSKAKSLLGLATALTEDHEGVVPRSIAELTALPGVGRKTANVVLGVAFGMAEGIVVDTHVKRVSKRLGLTRADDPVKVENDLLPLIDADQRVIFTHRIIDHGRAICVARKPRCAECALSDICPSAFRV